MNNQEILKYNKRCAEFLKLKQNSEGQYLLPLRHNWYGGNNYSEWASSDSYIDDSVYEGYEENCWALSLPNLEFNYNWNWIMKVVEDIEKLYDHPNKEINIDIRPGQIEIFQRPYRLESNDYHEVIYLGDGYINNSKKEAVVQAINQFLIWYNENK